MDNIKCNFLSLWGTSNFRVGSWLLDTVNMALVKTNLIQEVKWIVILASFLILQIVHYLMLLRRHRVKWLDFVSIQYRFIKFIPIILFYLPKEAVILLLPHGRKICTQWKKEKENSGKILVNWWLFNISFYIKVTHGFKPILVNLYRFYFLFVLFA